MSALTQEVVAEKLIWGLWRSIDDSYKEQYKSETWRQFEDAIRSASYTDSLKRFLSNIKRRIPMQIKSQYNQDILSVIESGEDEAVLDWLRIETTYLVMVCRVENQERREAYEEKML